MRPTPMPRVLWVLLGAVLALASGCRSSYTRLVDEDSIGSLATLKDGYVRAARRTSLVPTSGVSGAPLRVALHALGPGDRSTLVVALHGVFADSDAWRFVAGDLAGDHDLLLIDLPGCGASDKPDPAEVPETTYTLADTTRRVMEALQLHLRERAGPTPRVVLLAHSYGGAVAIRMFGDPALRRDFPDVVAAVESLALVAPLDVAVEKMHPLLLELSRVSGVEVWSARRLGLLRERVASGMLDSSFHPHRALRQEADTKIRVLSDEASRRSMQAMLNRAVPSRGMRPDWERIDPIVASYRRVDRPTLIIWGVHDEVLPVSMGYKLAAQLPAARLVTVGGAMHSLPLEQPELVATLVREFLAGSTIGRAVPAPVEIPAP
ncbi:MAG: alpha/beta hydrolase [Planctomycetota bacterium]|nr:alpha/beta hydrolase [Planctomycetota bacterium]